MLIYCTLFITLVAVLQASKILVFFPVPNTSHFKVGEGISLALAKAGHKVTLVSAYDYKSNLSNLNSVIIHGAVELHAEGKKGLVLDDMKSFGLKDLILIMTGNEEIVRFELSRPSVRNLLETGSFDLVIVEMFAEQALLGLGPHFGAPMIAVSTFGPSAWTNDLVGNPSPPSYIPHAFSSYPSNMKLLERMNNLLLDAAEKFLFHFYLHPGQVSVPFNLILSELLLK